MTRRSRRRLGTLRALRIVLPIVATVAIVAPLVWLWQASRVPASYSVMDMGGSAVQVGNLADQPSYPPEDFSRPVGITLISGAV